MNWERIDPLSFTHAEYGKLYRSELGEWVQENAEDGRRVLKADSLKDAFLEAEKPYQKPKKLSTKTKKAVKKIVKRKRIKIS